MRIRNTEHRDQIVLQMTPMIDIVFQLLVFFVFTFKIVLPEGDFNIRMPASAGTSAAPSETPLLKVNLLAKEDGEIGGIKLGDQSYTSSKNYRTPSGLSPATMPLGPAPTIKRWKSISTTTSNTAT